MATREIVKEYAHGDFTVVWKPRQCIHSEICVKTLPQVYDPKGKPWIKPENASVEALKAQIDKCPSAALTYYIKGETMEENELQDSTKVEVLQDGPLLVHGELEVTGTDGSVSAKKRTTAFCRCGASANKPYCDGMHSKIGFEG